ncbi:MAG: mannosyl-3-phosphoglycerate synthase [Halobacteriota archaeon]
MLLESLSTIYHSKLCNEHVMSGLLGDLVDVLKSWETPPQNVIMPPIGGIDVTKFVKALECQSETFTWLGHGEYTYDAVIPALEAVKKRSVPVIFCTAKTQVANEYYRTEQGIKEPFIVENGGATYDELRKALMGIREETELKIRGFGDMTAEEVAEVFLKLYPYNNL